MSSMDRDRVTLPTPSRSFEAGGGVMTTLIDFHCHFFSRTFFRTLAERSPLAGTPDERLARVAADLGLELPSEDDERHKDRWLAEMDRYGVGHLVAFASVPEEAEIVAKCAARSEGRITAFSVVDPTSREAPERTAQLMELGVRGVLLFPAMHRFRIDGPEANAVFDVLEEHDASAVVHCGILRIKLRDVLGFPRAYDPALANPLHLVPPADAHPNVRFIVPHFGAGFFRETLMAGAQAENVYVDTSSSNSWVDTQATSLRLADVFERALKVFGHERILFGTDSSVFPRGWRQDVLTEQREAIGACGLAAPQRARIFSGNAAQVLDLK